MKKKLTQKSILLFVAGAMFQCVTASALDEKKTDENKDIVSYISHCMENPTSYVCTIENGSDNAVFTVKPMWNNYIRFHFQDNSVVDIGECVDMPVPFPLKVDAKSKISFIVDLSLPYKEAIDTHKKKSGVAADRVVVAKWDAIIVDGLGKKKTISSNPIILSKSFPTPKVDPINSKESSLIQSSFALGGKEKTKSELSSSPDPFAYSTQRLLQDLAAKQEAAGNFQNAIGILECWNVREQCGNGIATTNSRRQFWIWQLQKKGKLRLLADIRKDMWHALVAKEVGLGFVPAERMAAEIQAFYAPEEREQMTTDVVAAQELCGKEGAGKLVREELEKIKAEWSKPKPPAK